MDGQYLLDSAAAPTGQRFSGIERTFDEATFRYLAATGVTSGWSCWEIGAGSGSVARWMADRVTPGGSVLATDLETKWMAQGSDGLRVARHDVRTDPIPEQAYELIHARLVLVHIAERDQVLTRLVAALRPGGWLVVEDFDAIFEDATYPVSSDEAVLRFVNYAFNQLLIRRGADPSYARTLPHRLVRTGLRRVGAEGRVIFTPGGSPGAGIQVANLHQVGEQMASLGLGTPHDIERAIALLEDPAFMWAMPMMVSAWGQKESAA